MIHSRICGGYALKPKIIQKKPFARIIRSMAAVALAAVAAVTCLLFLPACSSDGQESSLSMTIRHADASCSAAKKGVCVSKYSKTENANEESAEKIEALGCGW